MTPAFPARYRVWMLERFPPMNFISGVFLYLFPLSLSYLATGGLEKKPWWFHALAGIIPALHLYLLRIFDEHKDFESDRIINPHRALQRGVVTLKELRVTGWIAAALQIAAFAALAPSNSAIAAFAATWIWTLLMWKEFFAKPWLTAHYLSYAFLHLLITPLILLTASRLARMPWELTPYLVALGFLTGLIYETARKTKAPDEETADSSYSKLWGIKNATLFVGFTGLLIVTTGAALFWEVRTMNPWTEAILIALLALHFASLYKFTQEPTPKNRKGNEGTSALLGLAVFVTPVICMFC